MVGMFHDAGIRSVFIDNVAAGSERAGFSTSGVACDDVTSFTGNEAHACLAGFWLDRYNVNRHGACAAIHDIRAWKIHLYGIYAEARRMETIRVRGARIADAQVDFTPSRFILPRPICF